MVIKQKWVSMLFYSNRKAHPFSISDVPIYKSIFHLLQAPPVTVYKPLFFNVSSTILMTAHIFRAFSMPKILFGLFGFDGIWTEIYGFIVVKLLVDKPILTSYGLNYWWTIGANEVQFCRQRTNTYLTDLHRALAHSLKTRMGWGSIFFARNPARQIWVGGGQDLLLCKRRGEGVWVCESLCRCETPLQRPPNETRGGYFIVRDCYGRSGKLLEEKQALYGQYKTLRQDMIAYQTAKQNVDRILGLEVQEQEQKQQDSQTR